MDHADGGDNFYLIIEDNDDRDNKDDGDEIMLVGLFEVHQCRNNQ